MLITLLMNQLNICSRKSLNTTTPLCKDFIPKKYFVKGYSNSYQIFPKFQKQYFPLDFPPINQSLKPLSITHKLKFCEVSLGTFEK